ncbi:MULTISPECIES: PQQ-dependent sugar dehydrogenase [Asticcacaulis]|uniref:PQQ-dependent sugar dehydrogenase n=1 Tax=Asticcacaulis TaxID=76890 RepID=UPI001AE76B75|nr:MULTISPECIES: PQQ-dependent sugar dehydrogenase [Asticcacaulis]MBP2159745.1 glucose/arabinose dehydrogenase [Asticcacaulis solisilvae]MDR6800790.1 glucose/arabinose dehydrogenase [Asticcacaulis sp. BE141]
MKSGSRISLTAMCVALAACGGGSGGGSGGGGSGGSAPVVSSAGTVTAAENTVGAVYTVTATDADGGTLTYGLGAGGDAADFTINATTGAVTFARAPNFEWPADANRDNVYELNVTASDGTHTSSRAVTITVENRAGRISTRRIGQGFASPVFVLGRGDGSDRVLVVEKNGLIKVHDPVTGVTEAGNFLDVRSDVSIDGERGLLGAALAPDFATSGILYVCLTAKDGAVQVRKFTVSSGAAAGTGDIILSIPHADRNNHNGGWIGFDAAGNLVVAVGDGGGAGDPEGDAQNTNSLLGKILRIDPRSDAYPADANRDYAIPASNPFASGSGGAPEVWHWGLRNPFRNSFDRMTGNLYVGDVGEGAMEEVNLARPADPGLNYGWNIREGTLPFGAGSTTGLTEPIIAYAQGTGSLQGRTVIGGYVYRGPVVALRGHYVFGDFINRRLWSLPASSIVQGTTLTGAQFTDRTNAFVPSAGSIGMMTSFGEDDMSNLYIVDYDGEIFLVDEVDEAP